MRNSGAGPTNKIVVQASTRDGGMSFGILALVAGCLVMALLVVIAALLFRPND
jgi:hypothetical protein